MNKIIADTFYLWSVLLLIPLWSLVYYKRKNSRSEMIQAGLSYALAAMVIGQAFSSLDYWHPNYILGKKIPVEEFLYGFFYGGIVYEFYEFLSNRNDSNVKQALKKDLTLVFALFSSVAFFFCLKIIKWHSTNAMIAALIVVGIYKLILRPNLFRKAILSALSITFLTLIWQKIILWIYPTIIIDNWHLKALSNIFIIGIPIEELLFACSMGFGGSSLGIFKISIMGIFYNYDK